MARESVRSSRAVRRMLRARWLARGTVRAGLRQQLLRQRPRVQQHHEHVRGLDRTADAADRVQLKRRGFEVCLGSACLPVSRRVDTRVGERCPRMHLGLDGWRRQRSLLLHADLRGTIASALRSSLRNFDLQRPRQTGRRRRVHNVRRALRLLGVHRVLLCTSGHLLYRTVRRVSRIRVLSRPAHPLHGFDRTIATGRDVPRDRSRRRRWCQRVLLCSVDQRWRRRRLRRALLSLTGLAIVGASCGGRVDTIASAPVDEALMSACVRFVSCDVRGVTTSSCIFDHEEAFILFHALDRNLVETTSVDCINNAHSCSGVLSCLRGDVTPGCGSVQSACDGSHQLTCSGGELITVDCAAQGSFDVGETCVIDANGGAQCGFGVCAAATPVSCDGNVEVDCGLYTTRVWWVA